MQKPNKLSALFADNPILAIGAVLLPVMIVLVIIVIFFGNKSGPEGREYVAPDSPAFLVYQKQAYFPFASIAANDALRADVAFYARHELKAYDPAKQPSVVFTLSQAPSVSESGITLTGHFEKSKDTMVVKATRLSNDRLKTSITNLATQQSIDSLLPSNSKRNQFIGSLPQKSGAITIDYNNVSDTYIGYTDSVPTKADGQRVKSVILAGLGVSDIKDTDLTFSVYRSGSFKLSELQ